MSEKGLPMKMDQGTPPTVTTDITQSMQGQAAGMIALDVEAFSQGFMQIMLAGIGWASAEIARTEGVKGEKQLAFFTEKLSADLPLIIQNITAAANGSYTPPPPNTGMRIFHR